jgi:hypothetical protein
VQIANSDVREVVCFLSYSIIDDSLSFKYKI